MALTILAFVLVPLAGSLVVAQHQTIERGREFDAVRAAEMELELLRSVPYSELDQHVGERDVPGDRGLIYDVSIEHLSETACEVIVRVLSENDDRELAVVSTVRTQPLEIDPEDE